MASKSQTMKVAARFGFVLDESVSGRIGDTFLVTLDHPTHSICGDCRSIHVETNFMGAGEKPTCAETAWDEAIERMEEEGLLLEPCTSPDCDYHHGEGA